MKVKVILKQKRDRPRPREVKGKSYYRDMIILQPKIFLSVYIGQKNRKKKLTQYLKEGAG